MKMHFNSFGTRTANCGKYMSLWHTTDKPEEVTCLVCKRIAADTAEHRYFKLSRDLMLLVRTIGFKESDDPNITLIKSDEWAAVGILLSKIKEQEDVCVKLGRRL